MYTVEIFTASAAFAEADLFLAHGSELQKTDILIVLLNLGRHKKLPEASFFHIKI